MSGKSLWIVAIVISCALTNVASAQGKIDLAEERRLSELSKARLERQKSIGGKLDRLWSEVVSTKANLELTSIADLDAYILALERFRTQTAAVRVELAGFGDLDYPPNIKRLHLSRAVEMVGGLESLIGTASRARRDVLQRSTGNSGPKLVGDEITTGGKRREIWGNCSDGTIFSGRKWIHDDYWTMGAKSIVVDSGLSMDAAIRRACQE